MKKLILSPDDRLRVLSNGKEALDIPIYQAFMTLTKRKITKDFEFEFFIKPSEKKEL